MSRNEVAQQIDVVCDTFEKEWLEGKQPRIKDFIEKVPPGDQPRLVIELVAMDREYREKIGDAVSPESYAKQLPAHDATIRELFKETKILAPDRESPSGDNTASLDRTAAYTPSKEAAAPKEFGDYELLREIARGGMGVVYKALQKKAHRVVALKMILSGKFADEEELRRFAAEAKAAASLDHPNIVPIYDVGEHAGYHFFSMAFVDGPSLRDVLRDGPLAPPEAARVVEAIAGGIHYAHQQGVIHRDLKPANVLLQNADRETGDGGDSDPTNSRHPQVAIPKITDFGLAKQVESDSDLTATGQILGTPSYMAPEQAAGTASEIGATADVYALGAILYTLVTGRPPFQAASIPETLRQVAEKDPVSLRLLNSSVDRDLETICLKCLEKQPAKRYPSAEQLQQELKRFIDGVPIQARRVSRIEHAWRWCKRNPSVASLVAAVFCSIAIGFGASLYFAALANKRANDAEAVAGIAMNMLETMINKVQDRLRLHPELRELRREILLESLADLETVAENLRNQKRPDRNTANVLVDLAALYEELGDEQGLNAMEKARDHYQRAVTIFRQLDASESPKDVAFIGQHARALEALGNFHLNERRAAQAEDLLRDGLRLRRDLASRDPNNVYNRKLLARSLFNCGDCRAGLRDFKGSMPLYREAIDECQALLELDSSDQEINNLLAYAYEKAGDACHDSHDNQAAYEFFLKCLTIREASYQQQPEEVGNLEELSFSYERLGNHWLQVGEPAKALEKYQKMLELTQRAVDGDPESRILQEGLGIGYEKVARAEAANGNQEAARDARKKAAEIRSKLSQVSK